MNSSKTSKILGIAFLLQFITSFSSGAFMRQALIVPGDIGKSMTNIAGNSMLMRANILIDMLTASGIIFLGVMLFFTLRKQNEKIALVGLCLYIIEASLLAVSRMATFILLRISQEYVAAGQPENYKLIGNIALESMDYVGSTLHMLPFSIGAILFYYLFLRSGMIHWALSLWGLISVLPCLIGTLCAILGYTVPFFIYLPYVPFEPVIGFWILVRGVKNLEI